ncbi:MAG TPA: HAMP domain-containing sensor histidine kinase [Acidimicrobiales bacterium]|nr:HAMP domain-containing sensor histidine kinase [Acidimicrobiales bacterium]
MSLRTRLLLAVAAVAVIALVIADVVTYQALKSFLYNRIDQSLEQSHIPIENALGGTPKPGGPAGNGGPGPGGAGAPGVPGAVRPSSSQATTTAGSTPSCVGYEGLAAGLLYQLPPGSYVEVRNAANTPVCATVTPGFGEKDLAGPRLPARITGFSANAADFDEPTVYITAPGVDADDGPYQVRASVLRHGPLAGGQLVVGVWLQSSLGTLDRLVAVELAVTGAALVAALLLGWWLVRVGLRPLGAVEATADAIARGELTQRVPGDDARTEVGRLARALNVMLGRIERAFAQRDATEQDLRDSEARMRRFVGDASHELRTPLAAVSAYAELFEQGAVTRAEDLERVMGGIRTETARMGHLVEDLLLLARLDEGRPLERAEVELVGLAAEAVQTAATVGPQWPVHLVARQPLEVMGDRLRLRQVLDNLLANVRSHCPPGTSAAVSVQRQGAWAVVTVSDDGPGLDADDAARVFERFFRADPSRSRRHGGSGLGLSIVASITRAHGGTVTVAPGTTGGTVFTVRLPAGGDEASPDPGEPQAGTVAVGTGADAGPPPGPARDGDGTGPRPAPDSQRAHS